MATRSRKKTEQAEALFECDDIFPPPPLKWAGGKRWLVPMLRKLYAPYHRRRLVEPFVGGLAVALGLPVILVVGMRLGCINHALLTQQAIAARGLKLTGWIANRIDPAMPRFAENQATLEARLAAPLLASIPPHSTPQSAARLFVGL